MSRLDRTNGIHDEICNTIVNRNTGCIQIVRENKRYVFFPSLRICCLCCDSEHGCGMLRRDWLKDAKFAGK